jgi:copper chaperone
MKQYELTVDGMSCTGCEETISKAIHRVEGVHRVVVDHKTGTVEITAKAGTDAAVEQAIHDAGYDIPA